MDVLTPEREVQDTPGKHSLYNIDTIIQESPILAREPLPVKSPQNIERVFSDVQKIEQTLLKNRKFTIESLKSTESNSTYLLPFNFKKKSLVVTPSEI